MVTLLQSDVMAIGQNWEHVEFVLNHCNITPKTDLGCDFSRIRPYAKPAQTIRTTLETTIVRMRLRRAMSGRAISMISFLAT